MTNPILTPPDVVAQAVNNAAAAMLNPPALEGQVVQHQGYVDPVISALYADISPTLETMSPWMRIFVYGSMDAGKTVFAAGAPDNLYVNADKGLASIYNHPELVPNVRPMNFRSINQLESLVQKMGEQPAVFERFKTITIDKITDVAHMGIREITEREAAMTGRNPNTFETDDRVENNERIRTIMANLCRLDKNVIVIAAAKTLEPKGKPAITMPEFSERMVGTLGGMFDIVGYMSREDDGTGQLQHTMRIVGGQGIIARTRIGGLPPVILNPTWPDIFAAYERQRQSSLSQG